MISVSLEDLNTFEEGTSSSEISTENHLGGFISDLIEQTGFTFTDHQSYMKFRRALKSTLRKKMCETGDECESKSLPSAIPKLALINTYYQLTKVCY